MFGTRSLQVRRLVASTTTTTKKLVKGQILPGKEATVGPLRSLPRWDRVGAKQRGSDVLVGSTLRWEQGS